MNRVSALATRGDRAEAAKALQAGISPDQKLKAMDPEIARNQNHDHHDANDSKDVHSVVLHSMTNARAVCLYAVYPPLAHSVAVVSGLVRRRLKQSLSVIATVYIPSSRLLRRAERV